MESEIVSNVAYDFDEVERDRIIRVTAYERKDHQFTVARIDSAAHLLIAESLLDPFSTDIVAGLGVLECLPLEIGHYVCGALDIKSLFSFRSVNRRARQIVTAYPPYVQVVKHALKTLCVVFRCGTAYHFTMLNLFTTLCSKTCLVCGWFGNFICLPTCSRCCFECISKGVPELSMIARSRAKARYDISETALRRLVPSFRSLPGIYTLLQVKHTRRVGLVAEMDLRRALSLSSTPDPWLRHRSHINARESKYTYTFMATTTLPYLNIRTGTVEHGISCKGCHVVLLERLRMNDYVKSAQKRNRVYSEEGFLEHFRWCKQAQILWNCSMNGTVPLDEPLFTKRGGIKAILDAYALQT